MPVRFPGEARLTRRGWGVLALGLVLASTPAWPSAWLLTPLAVVPGVALLAAIGVAWLGGAWGVARLHLAWDLPRTVTARDEVAAAVIIQGQGHLPPVTLLAWHPLRRRDEPVARLAAVDRDRRRAAWTVRFTRRGIVRLPPPTMTVAVPFGVVLHRRSGDAAVEVLVRPALGHLRRRAREALEAHLGWGGGGHRREDADLATLRDYRRGDPLHGIHWRATARVGHLQVVEREVPQARDIPVVVDGSATGLERRVVVAATVLAYLVQRGARPVLHLAEGVIVGTVEEQWDALALTGPAATPPLPPPGAVLITDQAWPAAPDLLVVDARCLARGPEEGA